MSISTWLYVRPDEIWSNEAAVSVTAGAVDVDYQAAWAVDERPGRPVLATSGTLTLSLTNPSGTVGLVAICNHRIDAGRAIAFSGGVSATISPDTYPPNGIPTNPWAQVTPASVTGLSVAISGNSTNVVIGEIVAGNARTLTPIRIEDATFNITDFAKARTGDFLSIPPYDYGLQARTLKGSQYYSGADLTNILAWYDAQRSGTRPSLLIPNPDLNDAWLGFLDPPSYQVAVPGPAVGSPPTDVNGLYLVTLSFTELPRVRW